MTPTRAIAMLDRAVARSGQTAVLRRVVPNAAIEKSLRVFFRGYTSDEITGGIQQGDSLVAISPTEWAKTGLPDLARRNDRLNIAGRLRNVENVDPIYIDDKLVRINLQVRG